MRILEIETFGRGGLTHYAYNLSLALVERGHEIDLVTAAGFELDGRDELPAGMRVHQVIGRAGFRLGARVPSFARGLFRKLEALSDAFTVARLARRLRPDVVHLHCTNQIAWAYLRALDRQGLRLVSTAHVVTPHERIPWQDTIYRGIHGLGDLIVAHSAFDRQRLLHEFAVAPERVVVIPHGEYGFFESGGEAVDRAAARAELGLGPDEEVALFFGYIREYKGLDLLFEAWPDVAAARPDARLLIAGDPVQLGASRREELESWARRLGAVHRFGYIPFADVARYFAAADLLVMPYRHISQSGVLFLALSLGVPVVATRVGALPEMLVDGESALLLPPESTEDLSRTLIRALGDEELRQRLADGGRRVADNHSWTSIAARTEEAFNRLVGAGG